MLEFFTLCGIIVALFLVLLVSFLLKLEKIRLMAGILMSVTSLTAMILFIYIQKLNGNPDSGMEFEQFYFPISVFIVFTVIGILSSIKLVKS